MNEETDSILYWKARLEDMTRRWDAATHEVHLLRQEMGKRIAEEVVTEREECAVLCDIQAKLWAEHQHRNFKWEGRREGSEMCASIIRARGQA